MHDFGAVIGRPGQKMDHRYRLANATARDVAIVDVINRKTCCGVVQSSKATLRPGEATDIHVTLMVGDRFGAVEHVTEVVTDRPDEASIVLRTTAHAVPALRVEETSTNREAVLIGSTPRSAEFRVVATGDMADPVVDLDRLTLRSTLKVEWSGPKQSSLSEDEGLMTATRRFVARLDPAVGPGDHRAEVLLVEGDRVRFRHDIPWTVEAPLSASPRMIVLGPGRGTPRIAIRSRDNQPFRVDRVESATLGIRGHAIGPGSSLTQIVAIEAPAAFDVKQGSITVVTDHPAQPRVELPFVVLD